MNKKVLCIQCNKYFENIEDFNQKHNKVSSKVMNIKHDYLLEENCLAYISKILADNSKIIEAINYQNRQIQQISSKLNYYEDALKNDIIFETNINLKNIENKIDGKCLIHLFPKTINFRIECKGNIIYNGKKEFEIEILFPFQKSELKLSSIEKLQGCLSTQKVLNSSEQESIIFNNYSSIIIQKNYLISIKLLKNYYSFGNLEQKKSDISIDGILTFSSFQYNLKLSFIIYNIIEKKFICYENYKWKFIDNCFSNNGNIKENCVVNLELFEDSNEIYINNQYKFLGNKPDFTTNEKKDAKFYFKFLNKFYGIISIFFNNQFLSSEKDSGLVKLTNNQNFFIIYNV